MENIDKIREENNMDYSEIKPDFFDKFVAGVLDIYLKPQIVWSISSIASTTLY